MPATEKCDAVLVCTQESPLWAPKVYQLTGERDAVQRQAQALYEAADHDWRASGGIIHAVLVFTGGAYADTLAWSNAAEAFVPMTEAYGV